MQRSLLTLSARPAKRAVSGMLLVLVMFLMLFPFINTFNQLLIRVIEPAVFLRPLQEIIIPYEARLVRVLLGWLSIPVAYSDPASSIVTLKGKTGGLDPVAIGWNCLGWQSMVLVMASLMMGITGKFTRQSKFEVILFGVLGTFWLNIFRLTMIFYLYYHIDRETALLFHDFGAVVVTIIWLFFFWWYSFTFVLHSSERKDAA